jgi:hypothetical protein
LIISGILISQNFLKRPAPTVYAPEYRRESGRGVENSKQNQQPRRGPQNRQRLR